MPIKTETPPTVHLVGTKENPARDPATKNATGKGSKGDKAFIHALCIVIACWLFLIFCFYSLRNHSI